VVCCSAEVIVGPLAPGNILDWDLTVSDPVATITSSVIQGPLSGNNSQFGLVGSDLTEDASNLYFNFSGTDNGWLCFKPRPGFTVVIFGALRIRRTIRV